jgi:hypothetical protein
VVQAITRRFGHTATHVGQVVQLVKHLRWQEWKPLTIPRGKSKEFNSRMSERFKPREEKGDGPFCRTFCCNNGTGSTSHPLRIEKAPDAVKKSGTITSAAENFLGINTPYRGRLTVP